MCVTKNKKKKKEQELTPAMKEKEKDWKGITKEAIIQPYQCWSNL
jgi:hypothetical protein